MEAGRSPRLGAGRADNEGLPGDAPRAFETGRETMELRNLRYFVAVAEERQAEAARLAARSASDRPASVLRIGYAR
jgi:hypothetical protein